MLINREKTETRRLPMLPIRDVVIFPHMMTPFVVGRESSVRALEEALAADKKIFLSTQHDASVDDPKPNEIFQVGTIVQIVQSVKLPDGNIKVLVEGVERARIVSLNDEEGYFRAVVRPVSQKVEPSPQLDALVSRVNTLFEQYVKLSQSLNYEVTIAAVRVDEPPKLSDTIAANLQIGIEEKQELLETFDPAERLNRIADILDLEIEKLNMDRSIQGRVKKQMERAQREYYLNEKLKAIQKELGRGEKAELDELKKKIESAGMTKDAQEKALQELKRLEMMPPMSAESTVSRNYLEWLLAVPWKKKSKEIRDLAQAEKVLEEDHYGLEKIKERILEYLAVRNLVKEPRGQILCFVGPPGVGKTSLGMSIARATGRKFVRLSLGGVRDEAEIRGHRRTYIGALPGRVIQGLKRAGVNNPIFMMDEIDKVGADFRGDPSSALLEVLDPEQNFSFSDHYLEVPFDLSHVMFIATANLEDPIHPALKDRLEIIELPGYTAEDKIRIAEKFLVPKQLEAHGLKPELVKFDAEALSHIISSYTREAGVRNLEREIANVCRGVAKEIVEAKDLNGAPQNGASPELRLIKKDDVHRYLGVIKYFYDAKERSSRTGVATGLAWTAVGGDILFVEATKMRGKGGLTLTGHLGEVMKESAQAALSYLRSKARQYGIDEETFDKIDIHIHVPAGAIPKDGPSAGVTMFTALVSLLTDRLVAHDVAMTGEITLRGLVLPIGGVKEKVLAAKRAGIDKVILPEKNRKDIEEIPQHVRDTMEFQFVAEMDDLVKLALGRRVRRPGEEKPPTLPLAQQPAVA